MDIVELRKNLYRHRIYNRQCFSVGYEFHRYAYPSMYYLGGKAAAIHKGQFSVDTFADSDLSIDAVR